METVKRIPFPDLDISLGLNNRTYIALPTKIPTQGQLHKLLKMNGGNGPSWLTFLGHTKDSLWSIDLFRCESILLKSHWVLVVMDQHTRRIIGFGVHAGDIGGIALCHGTSSCWKAWACHIETPRYARLGWWHCPTKHSAARIT
jgi:hypothetical protein